MMVSNDTGLYLTSQALLYSELSKSGQTNGNGGLVVKPGDKIKIQFEKIYLKVIHLVIDLLLLIMVDQPIEVHYQIGYISMVIL